MAQGQLSHSALHNLSVQCRINGQQHRHVIALGLIQRIIQPPHCLLAGRRCQIRYRTFSTRLVQTALI
jgi:hypothetical protein